MSELSRRFYFQQLQIKLVRAIDRACCAKKLDYKAIEVDDIKFVDNGNDDFAENQVYYMQIQHSKDRSLWRIIVDRMSNSKVRSKVQLIMFK